MNVIAHSFHAMWKTLRVNDDIRVRVAAHLPAIVNVHVLISGVFHSRLDQGVGHIPDHLFADIAAKFIPRVPSHRWSRCEPVRGAVLLLSKENGRDQKKTSEYDLLTCFHASVFIRMAPIAPVFGADFWN